MPNTEYNQPVNWKEARTTGSHGVKFTLSLDEGTVAVHKGTRTGGDSEISVFQNPVNKKDYVTLSNNMLAKKATASTDLVIGQLITNPKLPAIEPDRGTHNYGEQFTYTINGKQAYRFGTIEFFGTSLRRVPIATGETVALGGYVTYAGANKFKAADSNKVTGAIALEAATETKNEIVVLFGFKPIN